ncbi:unnamed protein product, partial [marine sediment metagenome]
TTTNTSIEINVSIEEANLDEVKFNWNGTNYTMYNDSLVLMMNFDNVSALGESYSSSDSVVVDLSSVGNNGITKNSVGGSWTTGKYGGAFDFEASSSEYIISSASNSIINEENFTMSAWFNPNTIAADDGGDRVITFYKGASAGSAIYIGVGNSNKFQFGYTNDGAVFSQVNVDIISTGNWYHGVVV